MTMSRFLCFLALGVGLNLGYASDNVLNSRACVDPNAELVIDTCPTVEEVQCPSGPCYGSLFFTMGCDMPGSSNDVMLGKKNRNGGSYANPPAAASSGNVVTDDDYKVCYEFTNCWCRNPTGMGLECIEGDVNRYIIRKYSILQNVTCEIE
jgi:hypothetical protein